MKMKVPAAGFPQSKPVLGRSNSKIASVPWQRHLPETGRSVHIEQLPTPVLRGQQHGERGVLTEVDVTYWVHHDTKADSHF